MLPLPRKGVLAIAVVIDIALHIQHRPITAKTLANRHRLPPRHLEPILQALVREGILKGMRGPHGGYQLARARDRINADDILRAAGTVDEVNGELHKITRSESPLLRQVVRPALSQAEAALAAALSSINVEELARTAESFHQGPLESNQARPNANAAG